MDGFLRLVKWLLENIAERPKVMNGWQGDEFARQS
jgi:hypothetical protein